MVQTSIHHNCSNRLRPARRSSAVARASLGFVGAILVMFAVAGQGQVPGQQWPQSAPRSDAPVPTGADPGDLDIYDTRHGLLAAADGVPLRQEDFAAGFTTPGMVSTCFQAVGHLANDPCFAPGDLQPGFGIRSSRGSIFDANQADVDVVTLGESILGTPTKVVGANIPDLPWNPTRIDFDPHPTVIGMDVYDGMQGQTVQLWVYDAAEQLIGSFSVEPTATNAPVFAGFISPVPVRRVEINALVEGGAELIGHLIYGGGAGRLVAAQSQLDFGPLAVGDSAEGELELINHGHLDHLVSTLPVLPAPYQLLNDGCSGITLAMDESCSVEIGLAPQHEGNFDRPFRFGEGEHDRVRLRGQARGPRLASVPGHLDFGSVAAGASSPPQTLTLVNLTGATVRASQAALVAPPFSRVGGDCAVGAIELQPGDACTLELVFAPAAAGEFDADLHLQAGATRIVRASLHGVATQTSGGGQ